MIFQVGRQQGGSPHLQIFLGVLLLNPGFWDVQLLLASIFGYLKNPSVPLNDFDEGDPS